MKRLIFGYVKNDGKLVIDEHEAEMVRMIYKLYSTGDYSLRNISDILYSEGFKNHSGKPISHTTIKAIIQNPKYKGYYCGNKVKVVDYRTKLQKFHLIFSFRCNIILLQGQKDLHNNYGGNNDVQY